MRILLICLTLVSALHLPAGAQTSFSARLDSLLLDYSEKELFSGSVLVAVGEQVFRSGYGLANRSWNIPNDINTRFEIASLTKPFTAMLVLQLAERGALALDDPISMYLPDYPGEYGADVTLLQLLNHTSGIPNYTDQNAWIDTTSRIDVHPPDFMEKIAERELDFVPGSDFNYSNSNYYLLGIIIEKATGMSYNRVLQEQIMQPANMRQSGYLFNRMVVDSLAEGYERLHDNLYEKAPYHSPSTSYSAGGIYASVTDLYRWEQELSSGRLLQQESLDRMLNPNRGNYALGWLVGEVYSGEVTSFLKAPFSFESQQRDQGQPYRLVWHWGSNPGFNALMVRVPEQQWSIIILENQQLMGDPEGTHIYDIAGTIFGMLAGSE